MYLFRHSQNPDEPLSNDDQAIIAKNVVILRLLGCIEGDKIVEAYTLPGILSFVRRPTDQEYAVLAASPLAQVNV